MAVHDRRAAPTPATAGARQDWSAAPHVTGRSTVDCSRPAIVVRSRGPNEISGSARARPCGARARTNTARSADDPVVAIERRRHDVGHARCPERCHLWRAARCRQFREATVTLLLARPEAAADIRQRVTAAAAQRPRARRADRQPSGHRREQENDDGWTQAPATPATAATSTNRQSQGARVATSRTRTPVSRDNAARFSGALTSTTLAIAAERRAWPDRTLDQDRAERQRREAIGEPGQRQPPFMAETEQRVDVGRVEVTDDHRRQEQQGQREAAELIRADPPGARSRR